MSNPLNNLGDKFDALGAQLAAQHDELLAALVAHRNATLVQINRIEQLLRGEGVGDNTLFTSIVDTATRSQFILLNVSETAEQAGNLSIELAQFRADYGANNPLIVGQLNQLNDTAAAQQLLDNATNQTVGEILVHLQECMDCGEPVFTEPGDCGSKQLLITSFGEAGSMHRESDDVAVVANRLWAFDTTEMQLGMPYGTDTLYLSNLNKAFYWPDHTLDNVYISNIGTPDAVVYYSDGTGNLNTQAVPSGTICFPVPETWVAFVISYDPGATGWEAYIGVSAKA